MNFTWRKERCDKKDIRVAHISLFYSRKYVIYAKQKSIVRARRKICNQTKAQALQRHPVLPSAMAFHGYQRSKSFTPFIKINCNMAHFISRITLCRRYFMAVHFIVPEEVSDISITSARVRLHDRISRKEAECRIGRMFQNYGRTWTLIKRSGFNQIERLPTASAKRYYVLCTDLFLARSCRGP
jgi:hypothetical protein